MARLVHLSLVAVVLAAFPTPAVAQAVAGTGPGTIEAASLTGVGFALQGEYVAPVSTQPIYAIQRQERSPLLTTSYALYGVLQGLDVYTTTRALKAQAREANPLLRPFAHSPTALLLIKGGATAVTLMAVEKLSKRNRAAAFATMVALNAVYGAVVIHNIRVNSRVR